MKVVSVQSGWYQIEQGYVSAAYVEETDYTPAAASSKGQELANIALQYVGYSYAHGGPARASALTAPALCSMPAHSSATPSTAPPPLSCKNGVTVSWDRLAPGDPRVLQEARQHHLEARHARRHVHRQRSFVHALTMASALSSATSRRPTNHRLCQRPPHRGIMSNQSRSSRSAGPFLMVFFCHTGWAPMRAISASQRADLASKSTQGR